MPMPYSFTPAACHQRMTLAPPDRDAVDKLLLGVRMAPTIGSHDPNTGWSIVHGAEKFRIVYRIVEQPVRQVVIADISVPRRRAIGPRVVWSGVNA